MGRRIRAIFAHRPSRPMDPMEPADPMDQFELSSVETDCRGAGAAAVRDRPKEARR